MGFKLRLCCYWNKQLICKGVEMEPQNLSEGRNIVKGDEIFKLPNDMVLVVENDKKTETMTLKFYEKSGSIANEVKFSEVAGQLEIEKLFSVLSILHRGKYHGITVRGENLGDYNAIFTLEEEEQIVGEDCSGSRIVLGSIYDNM